MSRRVEPEICAGSFARRHGRNEPRPQISWIAAMPDFLMIAYGVGFFVVAILYVLACEKM